MKRMIGITPLLGMFLGAGTALAQPAPDPMVPATGAASSGDGYRPAPMSVGLGGGWNVGTASVLTPNIASVRFVVSDTLQVEPFVALALASNSTTPPTPPGGMTPASATDSTITTSVGANGRYRLASSGAVDLQALAGARLTNTIKKVGDNGTSEQAFTLNWGIAVAWYFYKTCAFSVDATNPFFIFTHSGGDGLASKSGLAVGAVFNPAITANFHVYF